MECLALPSPQYAHGYLQGMIFAARALFEGIVREGIKKPKVGLWRMLHF